MNSTIKPQLIEFLQQEFLLAPDAIAKGIASLTATAIANRDHDHQLPMILWQKGLVNLQQLDRIFDWLATT